MSVKKGTMSVRFDDHESLRTLIQALGVMDHNEDINYINNLLNVASEHPEMSVTVVVEYAEDL